MNATNSDFEITVDAENTNFFFVLRHQWAENFMMLSLQ